MDVVPHVNLGPVRQRKHAQAFAFAFARVVQAPEFGSLLLRIPLMVDRADRKHPFLGPRLFLVATCAAKRAVEAVLVERMFEGLRLHDVGVDGRPVLEGVDPADRDVLEPASSHLLHLRRRRNSAVGALSAVPPHPSPLQSLERELSVSG